MNKLSLVGMQLPETYKENFNVSSEVPSSGVTIVGGTTYTGKDSLLFMNVLIVLSHCS
jgi:hypothetical protein